MRTQLTNTEYILCDNQGRIFEHIARTYTYETFLSFVPAFMRSRFCRAWWDVLYSPLQMNLVRDNLDFMLPELKTTMTFRNASDDDQIFNPDAAWWIGFTYRQLQILTGIPSRQIIEKISLEDLCAAYPGLHTISEGMSAERLIEGKFLTAPAANTQSTT